MALDVPTSLAKSSSLGDDQGRGHFNHSNGLQGQIPKIGETIEIIYSAVNSDDAAINDYFELEGRFRFSLFVSVGLFVLCLTSSIIYFIKSKKG